MATAKKLASGSWRVQATKFINKKRVVKSFTVSPSETGGDSRKAKALAEMKASEWQYSKEAEHMFAPTVDKAIKNYISEHEKVLSPRTKKDYQDLIPYFASIKDICIDDLKSADFQLLINEWSVKLSKKTIQNRIGFIMSVLNYAECDRKFKLRYPQKATRKVVAPDLDDIHRLLKNAKPNFRPIIALAAFGSLRRGEICALKQKDISRDMHTIFVHADMVQTEEGIIYKDFPKTSSSIRTVQLPKFIIDMIPVSSDPEAFVFNNSYNINQVTSTFTRLRNKCGLECSFHSLRHYAASFRSDLGIPQKYIEEIGGWDNDSPVLKSVYDNTLTSSRKKYTQMANDFIEEKFKKDFAAV